MPRSFVDPALLRRCIQCGDCLPSCSTYLELGTEADSPRGRIHLMSALSQDRIRLGPEAVRHIDLCLACGACEASCPHEVPFAKLLEATRAHVEANFSRPPAERTRRRRILHWMPHGERLARVLPVVRFLQRWGLWERLCAIDPLAEWIPPLTAVAGVPPFTASRGSERGRVGLFLGCTARLLTAGVGSAAVRVLTRNGISVLAPASQVCCGAIDAEAGNGGGLTTFARRNIDAFAGCKTIVVTAAGCGATLRAYGRRLADDPAYGSRAQEFLARVRDIGDFLVELGIEPPRRRLPARIAYHEPCRNRHEGTGAGAHRLLLSMIPGVELLDVPEEEVCCGGSAGYTLTQPEMARRLRVRKAECVRSTGASAVAAADTGCLLQLQAGLRECGRALRVAHPIEYLDEAYG